MKRVPILIVSLYRYITIFSHITSDLRNPATTPLNFTKSINLALSERGINAIRHAETEHLLENVLHDTIPMHGRMIHGRKQTGELFHDSQKYDAHGRVSTHYR